MKIDEVDLSRKQGQWLTARASSPRSRPSRLSLQAAEVGVEEVEEVVVSWCALIHGRESPLHRVLQQNPESGVKSREVGRIFERLRGLLLSKSAVAE